MRTINELFSAVEFKPLHTIVVANAIDDHTIEAVAQAVKRGIVKALLVGDKQVIVQECRNLSIDESIFEIIHIDNEQSASDIAVDQIVSGKASLLMKGLVPTDRFIKAVLNKEKGLLKPGNVLSHVTLMEFPNYHKLLVVGDVAIIPNPTLQQKIAITRYLIQTSRALGVKCPKVAFLAATEQIVRSMPACVDGESLTQLSCNGEFGIAVCFGPIAIDVALDKEAASIKQIESDVVGDADCLLFPNIESGNVFYKVGTKMSNANSAAIVAGAKVPIVLVSRSDSMESKLNSIALAAFIGKLNNDE